MPRNVKTVNPRGVRRDWRLAAVSACCTLLGCVCVLLAACGSNGVRPIASAPQMPVPTPDTPVAAVDIPTEPMTSVFPARDVSPWQRLRDRYAMPGCDYSPNVQKFAGLMASSPRHLNAALKQAMPFLLVVTDQIEKFDMPGEFAFLPWVESSYNMIRGNGDSVAGMWQLMPETARESGLRVDAEYDGRLDVYSSSRTALVLLKQYKEEFGDWRLANMAFNAGENSIKQAVGNRRSITPLEIERLRLNQTNYEHLTKLLALACIVSAPERFHVQLPEPAPDDVLALLDLPAPVDLRLAATIAGIDLSDLQHWNPAYLKSRMPDHGPYHLLLPASRRSAVERTLGMLPQYTWRDWRDMRLQQAQSVDVLSMAYDLDARALAAINGIDASATLPSGTRVLLPGRGGNDAVAAVAVAEPDPGTLDSAQKTAADACTVRSGDTLWNIARRYGVHIDDLLHWNRLSRDATLRLGQRIRLVAPDADALTRQ